MQCKFLSPRKLLNEAISIVTRNFTPSKFTNHTVYLQLVKLKHMIEQTWNTHGTRRSYTYRLNRAMHSHEYINKHTMAGLSYTLNEVLTGLLSQSHVHSESKLIRKVPNPTTRTGNLQPYNNHESTVRYYRLYTVEFAYILTEIIISWYKCTSKVYYTLFRHSSQTKDQNFKIPYLLKSSYTTMEKLFSYLLNYYYFEKQREFITHTYTPISILVQ